jgi:hypothetical protein
LAGHAEPSYDFGLPMPRNIAITGKRRQHVLVAQVPRTRLCTSRVHLLRVLIDPALVDIDVLELE